MFSGLWPYLPFLLIIIGEPKVCCANLKPKIKKTPIPKCSDNVGKECLPIHKCGLDSTILTSSATSNLINITENGIVDLDAQANLCEVDNEVCCTKKKQQPPIVNRAKPYYPKCGQRNILGSGVRVINPCNGKETTQFGEWPHACIVYKKTPGKRDSIEFLGGASLIAPGMVITASHKLMDLSNTFEK